MSRRAPFDVVCDVALDDELATRFSVTFANDEEDGVSRLLRSEGASWGCPTPAPTSDRSATRSCRLDFLAHLGARREVMSLAGGSASSRASSPMCLGLDRGYLRVGQPADLVVLDYEHLDPGPFVACATCRPTANASSPTHPLASTPSS